MAMTHSDWDDLDQFLGDVPEEDYESPDTLDADKANRMMRKLRRLQQWRTDTLATADAEVQRIVAWRDGRDRMISGEIGRIEDALEAYMRGRNRQDPKIKTQNLPNGTLKLRAPRTRVQIDDREAFMNWALGRVNETYFVDAEKAAPSTVQMVLDALDADPFLRIKIEPAGDGIGKLTSKGEARGTEYIPGDRPTNRWAAVMAGDDATVVPGVLLAAYEDDTFGWTLAVPDDSPEAQGAPDQMGEEL